MTKPEINHINSADVNIEDLTPVMQHYMEIKRQHPDAILLYQLGDFFETFFEDAVLMSKELELTLTGRDAGAKIGRVPLAGIPMKSVENYLEKLINGGHKIAICEQIEDPKNAKGLVKRAVIRVITPGTLTESKFLEQNKNNYICAIHYDKKSDLYGFAYTDISTGEFKITQSTLKHIQSELARIKPVEVIAPAIRAEIKPFQIVPDEVVDLPDEIVKYYNCSKIPANVFEENFAKKNLMSVLKTNSLEAFGYDECKLGFRAAAAIFAYAWENLKTAFPKFERIEKYELSDFVLFDMNTRRNLELEETIREKNKYGSLLWAIDKTKTNMGARLLRMWICQPLKNIRDIKSRQNIVEELLENKTVRNKLSDLLGSIYDIQRLSTRISNNSANPRDFVSLKETLFVLPKIFELTKDLNANMFAKSRLYQEELLNLACMIDRTIADVPSLLLKEGGIIKDGANGELDYLRDLINGGEKWLRAYEEEEKEKTGIKFLKIGYNKVFGFFIEVSNSNLSMVPNNYIRKQTLTGAERFITDELKKHEDEVLNAQFKSRELEYKIFCDFRTYANEFVEKIRELADEIAHADVLNAFAINALENNYVKPEIEDSTNFEVRNGRHPVLEKILPLGTYVANDVDLSAENPEKTQFMILTGPNMAGKSTYMRQNALIAILAQIGSYVPADYARIGVVDKIFTRVGASDDLTLGQSTFMVEMVETSYILNSATSKSLILLDEIGRGTSTYDGVAIAWAVAEHIVTKLGARCIFATHYHELNVMTQNYPQIKNFRVTISEENGKIEFLRKVVQGGASKSYGIQVAKMAGLPDCVIKRSEVLMEKLQKSVSNNLATRKKVLEEQDLAPQLNLF